jgi:predicted metal-binding membrane protein
LALAGGFQFSKLKRSCLTNCRDPRAFLYQRYRRGARGGWELGLRHGMSCLGCCWALMLVMVAAGAAALSAMVVLTAVMAAEKNTRWGARLATPVAVVLLVLSAAVALGVVPVGGGHVSDTMMMNR